MVGRNEKCPCGSGKKFKACCIDKILEFPQSPRQEAENIPGQFFSSGDPKYSQIKDDLRELYHLEKKNPHFLSDISISLGLLGNPEDGLIYAKKALKCCSKKNFTLRNAILTNLAAMSSEVGKHQEGLEYLKSVPDGFSRKNVIEANIRRNVEPFENVVHLYEEAIEEEPNFFLPYEHIISRLDHEDNKRDFLIDKAFHAMPDNPRAAMYWADKELTNRNFEVLADQKWINKVKEFEQETSPEQSTVNFSQQLPKVLGTLELIHQLSRVSVSLAENVSYNSMLKNSPDSLVKIEHHLDELSRRVLPDVEEEFKCSISRRLIDISISFGQPVPFEFYTSHLCASCKEHFPLEQLRFSSLFRKVKIMRNQNLVPEVDLITETLKTAKLVLEKNHTLEEDFVNSPSNSAKRCSLT